MVTKGSASLQIVLLQLSTLMIKIHFRFTITHFRNSKIHHKRLGSWILQFIRKISAISLTKNIRNVNKIPGKSFTTSSRETFFLVNHRLHHFPFFPPAFSLGKGFRKHPKISFMRMRLITVPNKKGKTRRMLSKNCFPSFQRKNKTRIPFVF